MKWKYVKPLLTKDLIVEFSQKTRHIFPATFRLDVLFNNGGRPDKSKFVTDKGKEHEIKSFLSFNKDDKETVWGMSEWNKEELSDKYIPFAIDNFGNLICFVRENNSVAIINHETCDIEKIAENYVDFVDKVLY